MFIEIKLNGKFLKMLKYCRLFLKLNNIHAFFIIHYYIIKYLCKYCTELKLNECREEKYFNVEGSLIML